MVSCWILKKNLYIDLGFQWPPQFTLLYFMAWRSQSWTVDVKLSLFCPSIHDPCIHTRMVWHGPAVSLKASLSLLLHESIVARHVERWHVALSGAPVGEQQVEHLHHVEQQGHAGHHQHEDYEDGLLRGPGHVALHGEGTGLLWANNPGIHDEAVQIVLPYYECHLYNDPENDGGHVAPQKVAFNLDVTFVVRVFWEFRALAANLHVFSQLVLLVDDV